MWMSNNDSKGISELPPQEPLSIRLSTQSPQNAEALDEYGKVAE